MYPAEARAGDENRLFIFVQIFDGIFDRNNVAAARGINVIDHGRKRRRFSAARCSGDEHETPRFIGDFSDDGW